MLVSTLVIPEWLAIQIAQIDKEEFLKRYSEDQKFHVCGYLDRTGHFKNGITGTFDTLKEKYSQN